jgi:hypothetical protein
VTVTNNSLAARPSIRVRRDKKKSSHFHERSSTSSLVLGLPGETHRIIDRPSLHLPLTNRVPYSYTSKQNEVPQPFRHMPLCRSTKLTHKTRTSFFLHLMLSLFFLRNHLMLSFVNRQQQLSSPAPQLFLHSFGRSSPFPRVVVETCWVKRMMADVVTEKKRDLGTGWIGERFERTHRTAVLARAGPAANGRSGAGTRSLAGRSIASGGVRLTRPGWIRCCCRAGRVAKTLTDASRQLRKSSAQCCSASAWREQRRLLVAFF